VYVRPNFTLGTLPCIPRSLVPPSMAAVAQPSPLHAAGPQRPDVGDPFVGPESRVEGEISGKKQGADAVTEIDPKLRRVPVVSQMAGDAPTSWGRGDGDIARPATLPKRARSKSKPDNSKQLSHIIAANLNTLAELRYQHGSLSAAIAGQSFRASSQLDVIKPADISVATSRKRRGEGLSGSEVCMAMEKATCALLAHAGIEGESGCSCG
jgi:hypothetical protein